MANGLWGPKDREATAGAQDAEPPSSDNHPLPRASGAGAGAPLPAAHAGAGALDPASPESRLRADLQVCLALPGRGAAPPPPPRTDRTRRVPHPVLIGHAASLTPY